MQIKTSSTLANLLQICIDHRAHKAAKLVQAHIFRTNQLSDTFLVNRLIELHSKCGDTAAARRLFDRMPLRNIFSYHAVLDHYCKMNDLGSALQVFDQMPLKNSVSFNQIISLLARNGQKEAALEIYRSMRLSGFGPTRFTLASVLSACGGLSNRNCGRECHVAAIKLGLSSNLYVGNSLLCMYMKCGSILDAIMVFEDLPEHNEVSFTAMMEGLVGAGRLDEAFGIFRLIHGEGLIDPVSISSVLGSVCSKSTVDKFLLCDDKNEMGREIIGRQIHGLLVKLGFEQDLHVSNSLLDVYAKHGFMQCAEILFHSMTKVNVVSWNVMIAGYGKQDQIEKAIESVNRMRSCGFEPNEVTYVSLLTECLRSGNVETGFEIFNSIPSPSLTSWNAILSGFSQNECYNEVVKLFREMQFECVGPNRMTLSVVLSSCAGIGFLEGGRQIHAAFLKSEFNSDLHVATGLIGVYSKCGRLEDAKGIFDNLPQHDVICWNSMLAGLALNNNPCIVKAFTFFNQMLVKGILPTEFSYATLLNCCSSLLSLSRGRQVHGSVAKKGHENDVYVGTALVDMYCKCGQVSEAKKFFDAMTCKSTATWNEMINGYARLGRGHEAINLFGKMVENNYEPDSVTFVAVLTACSHSGLADVGLRIFNSMRGENFGLKPLNNHYACIVDCLGRAGRFSEIERIIDEMPCKDDRIVWEVLLSACRVHGCVELARKAANELFRLDPSDSGPYTLLANMYSSLGRWDDVKDVRSVIGEWLIPKEPGYSWV
ncbi:Pentatricopeptide repeat-containing protein [Striga hermonthica]|uniref:Pentatricopeptide repeat-containing protein n=1 Tax=Striga hermonthica TaxID=68872 RepID=A0A9N7N054_STRHE|nr:Pentatricopeptide repeat-containing protein [Striga hermonthica]